MLRGADTGGAWLGASLLTGGHGYRHRAIAAAAVTAVGLGLTSLSAWLESQDRALRVCDEGAGA